MNPDLVPVVDAAGLPGPIWLFQLLLVFTFFLHLLFVNVTLGGSLLAWVAHTRASGSKDDPRGILAARLTAVNGYGISLTITTGVAPGYFAVRIGKWLGARVVWVDSVANAEELSLSGHKAGSFVDLWLTQWPHLAGEGGPQCFGSVL